jgi:hypothetical protein
VTRISEADEDPFYAQSGEKKHADPAKGARFRFVRRARCADCPTPSSAGTFLEPATLSTGPPDLPRLSAVATGHGVPTADRA